MSEVGNPMGYCHVRASEKDIKCCSKCRSFVSKGKQQKARKICIHMHMLLCLQLCSVDKATDSESATTNTEEDMSNHELPNSAHERTIDVRMGILQFPYIIPPSIIIQSSSSCPDQLENTDVECRACGIPVGQSIKHPGSRGVSYLIRDQYPSKHINVLVKICSNCGVMHQSFPYEEGENIFICYYCTFYGIILKIEIYLSMGKLENCYTRKNEPILAQQVSFTASKESFIEELKVTLQQSIDIEKRTIKKRVKGTLT